MTNRNIIQRGTQTTGLGVMIDKCSLDSSDGGRNCVLRMLAVLISSTQRTTKESNNSETPAEEID